MALTRDSILHYWSSLHGVRAAVGGDPVFSRSSAGASRGFGRTLRSFIQGLPRFDVADLNDGTGERALLNLELARTNIVDQSENFGAWTISGSATLSAGQADPRGGIDAYYVEGGSNSDIVRRPLTFSGDGSKAVTIWVRQRTTTGTHRIAIRDLTGAVYRLAADITFSAAGVPTVSIVDGEFLGSERFSGGWYRLFLRTTAVTAANSHEYWIFPSWFVDAGRSFYIFGAQAEDGLFSTAYVSTAGSTQTRAADQLYWKSRPDWIAMAVYVRFKTISASAQSGNFRQVQLGGATDVSPRFIWYKPATGVYRFLHDPAGTPVTSDVTLSPARGDTIELLGLLFSDGSVRAIGSKNGAAVVAGATSAAQALSSVRPSHLWLNSIGAASVSADQYADVRIVKYADLVAATDQGRMDEMRDLVLDDAGNLLN